MVLVGFRFFANLRYYKLFFAMHGKNLRELSKEHGTISHLSIVTDQLEREGLIIKDRKGREIEIQLTEAGKECFELMSKFYQFSQVQTRKMEGI